MKKQEKIIEKDGEKYSDEELQEFIDGAYMLAGIFIDGVLYKEKIR